ncbi:MAG: DUF2807 domain-containing protein [Muribaculaceae bacterium]|nr:DUF2807 domain-containing protein [Muribaculaceae bacterium]
MTHYFSGLKRSRRSAIALILLAIICLSGVSATAAPRKHTLDIGQFNKINITDDIDVVYRCVADSTGTVAFTAEESLANAFIFTNSGGKLRVQINTEMVERPELPTIYLYSDYLTSAENGGNGTLTIETPHPCPEFKVVQVGNGRIIAEDINATEVKGTLATGNGNVVLSGKCDKASLKMVGAGSIQADRLQAKEVNSIIFGGGSIGCFAEQLLKVKGLGSTKIYYKGTPEIKKSGTAKIFSLEQERVTDYFISQ